MAVEKHFRLKAFGFSVHLYGGFGAALKARNRD
jgi:hypothetical protein